MITWRDTICIILEVFSITQQQLAAYLNVGEPALSRIKNGRKIAVFDSDAVFNNVFNPDTETSPAHAWKNDKKGLLASLKDTIDFGFPDAREALSDCWEEDDYNQFVFKLLRRTKNVPSGGKTELGGDRDKLTSTMDAPSNSVSVRAYDTPQPAVLHPTSNSHEAEPHIHQECVSDQTSDAATTEQPTTNVSLDSSRTESVQTVGDSETGRNENEAAGQATSADSFDGARLHIEDKYKCCRFCSKWQGVDADEVATCKIFKAQRTATGGKDCTYYNPAEGRITIEVMRCRLS